jgi:hypothetical protein
VGLKGKHVTLGGSAYSLVTFVCGTDFERTQHLLREFGTWMSHLKVILVEDH